MNIYRILIDSDSDEPIGWRMPASNVSSAVGKVIRQFPKHNSASRVCITCEILAKNTTWDDFIKDGE